MNQSIDVIDNADTGVVVSGKKSRIPVRNLWLLMLYASRLYQDSGTLRSVEVEENPDELVELVSEVLVTAVERRLRRSLGREYRGTSAVVTRVRGRIDTLATESRMLLDQGRIACHFDELTVDNPRNRLLLTALNIVPRAVTDAELARQARAQAIILTQYGVSPAPVDRRAAAGVVLHRNEREDAEAVDAARLLLDMAVATEAAGRHTSRAPLREAETIRKLFERAVRGFYRAVLAPPWRVSKGETHHRWPVADATPGLGAVLPIMRTDIQLERPGRRIIIETKFADALDLRRHGGQMLSRDHLFQVYAYVQSQHDQDSLSATAEGVLLYPVVGKHLDESATIQGHRYWFMTVDLAASARSIRSRLLEVPEAGTSDNV